MAVGRKKEEGRKFKIMSSTNAKCRLCRREGSKLFLRAARCFSPKCPIDRKGAVPPGQHGQKRRRRASVYAEELREKQRVKRLYGIRERQLKNYFKEARKLKEGTGDKLLELLERRLDNVLFRGGLTPSRSIARQIVSHKQVLVDGKRMNIPSYQVKTDQTVALTSKGMGRKIIKDFLKDKKATISPWLERKAAVVRVKRLPVRDEIEQDINEKLIIEFYSR